MCKNILEKCKTKSMTNLDLRKSFNTDNTKFWQTAVKSRLMFPQNAKLTINQVSNRFSIHNNEGSKGESWSRFMQAF